MGCTTSKPASRHRSGRSLSWLRNIHSMPADRRGTIPDHHITLKSCTLGSLKLDRTAVVAADDDDLAKPSPETDPRIITVAPTIPPPNEVETINAWELMEGLEDITPLRPPSAAVDGRSFSFSVPGSTPNTRSIDLESFYSHFDPETVSVFRKALVEISPQPRCLLRSPEPEKMASRVRSRYVDDESWRKTPDLTGIVRARIVEFQERIDARKAIASKAYQPLDARIDGGGRVVVYLTSLRVIRGTYDDCSYVRAVLKGYGVRVDERDVSMHRAFKEELNQVLGFEYGARRLPVVFVKGKYVGGAEEVRRMHEAGELMVVVEGCEREVVARGNAGERCEECGDVRFLVCKRCAGSCKVFVEEGDNGWAELGAAAAATGGGFWCRCLDCNENGIIRCNVCC